MSGERGVFLLRLVGCLEAVRIRTGPEVIRDAGGIGFYYADGRNRFFPWSNVVECAFFPDEAEAGTQE